MRFKLTITAAPGNDTEKVEVTYNASSWEAASKWANHFKRQLGMEGPSYSDVITYAEPTPEEAAEREARRRLRAELAEQRAAQTAAATI